MESVLVDELPRLVTFNSLKYAIDKSEVSSRELSDLKSSELSKLRDLFIKKTIVLVATFNAAD